MTTEPTDEALEQYMSEDTPLSQRYRHSHAEMPPDRLDSHILAAALAERDARNIKRRQRVKRPAWTIPLSIAAIMVLSVSLVTTMQQHSTEPMPFFDTDEMEMEIKSTGTNAKENETSSPNSAAEKVLLDQGSEKQVPPATNATVSDVPPQVAPLNRPMSSESADLLQGYSAETLAPEPESQPNVDAAARFSFKQKLSRQENELLTKQEEQLVSKLRELISGGEVDKARQVMRDFRKTNPTYSDATLIELIGEDWYQILLTE